MRSPRLDPVLGQRFLVEVDGLLVAGFSKVDGLGGEISTETRVEGGAHESPHVLPGAVTWSQIVLSKGLTGVPFLWEWFEATSRGVYRPRSGAILVQDNLGVPAAMWTFHEALPVKWSVSGLDAMGGNSVVIESLTLAHRGLSRPAGLALAAAHGLGSLL